jgi:hypothetical protein
MEKTQNRGFQHIIKLWVDFSGETPLLEGVYKVYGQNLELPYKVYGAFIQSYGWNFRLSPFIYLAFRLNIIYINNI